MDLKQLVIFPKHAWQSVWISRAYMINTGRKNKKPTAPQTGSQGLLGRIFLHNVSKVVYGSDNEHQAETRWTAVWFHTGTPKHSGEPQTAHTGVSIRQRQIYSLNPAKKKKKVSTSAEKCQSWTAVRLFSTEADCGGWSKVTWKTKQKLKQSSFRARVLALVSRMWASFGASRQWREFYPAVRRRRGLDGSRRCYNRREQKIYTEHLQPPALSYCTEGACAAAAVPTGIRTLGGRDHRLGGKLRPGCWTNSSISNQKKYFT